MTPCTWSYQSYTDDTGCLMNSFHLCSINHPTLPIICISYLLKKVEKHILLRHLTFILPSETRETETIIGIATQIAFPPKVWNMIVLEITLVSVQTISIRGYSNQENDIKKS